MSSPYTHIRIEQIPQRLDENFSMNADIADQQKRLAEAAPELLAALKMAVRLLKIQGYAMTGDATTRITALIDKLSK